MSLDGEKGPRIGECSRKSWVELVQEVGYDEQICRKFGLDLISDPPSPSVHLKRFPLSPQGRTAFEFTAEVGVNVSDEVRSLLKKIKKVNSMKASYSGIKGGVLITDVPISENLTEKSLDQGIHTWDTRTLAFLASRVALVRGLSQTETEPIDIQEERLDYWHSVVTRLFPYDGYLDGRIVVFCQHPFVDLDPPGLTVLLRKLDKHIEKNILGVLGQQMIFSLQIHSLAEITELAP